MNAKNRFEIKMTFLMIIIAALFIFTSCGPCDHEKKEQSYKYRVYYIGGMRDYTNDIKKDSTTIHYVNQRGEKIEAPYMNIVQIAELNKDEKIHK